MAVCLKVECINGIVKVEDIITAVNCMVDECNIMLDCCDTISLRNKIRTYRDPGIPNVLYMTDDGSDPKPAI